MEKRQRLLTTKAMISLSTREPRAEMGVAGIQSLGEEASRQSWVLPLCSSGRISESWTQKGPTWLVPRTRRVDPEEQELGPLRNRVKRGLWGAGKGGHWIQLPRLVCGVAAVECTNQTAAAGKSKPFLSPICWSPPTAPSQQDSDYRRESWPTPGLRFPKQHLQRWFEAKQRTIIWHRNPPKGKLVFTRKPSSTG